jgi:hypothetical protein
MRQEYYYRKNVFKNNTNLNKPYNIIQRSNDKRISDIVIAECWTKMHAEKITRALNNN